MKSGAVLGAFALALAAAAPAYAAPASSQACFFWDDVRNHTIADDHTLYLRTRQDVTYRVVMGDHCLAASLYNDPLALRPHGGSICKPIDLDISAHGTRCVAQSITRLTPAETAAIPKRLRP